MRIKLYCLPFAGGSSQAYRDLPRRLADFVEVVPVELPGRGRRFSETPLTRMHELVSDAFRQIEDGLGARYALFGHSMGACLGYLLARRARDLGRPLPARLFVSGRVAPSYALPAKNVHLLPRDDFLAFLRLLGGSPAELLGDPDLLEIFEPILRADLMAHEEYVYEEAPPLDVPITVLVGRQDVTPYEGALMWQDSTRRKIAVHSFVGGHFFLFDHLTEIARIVSGTLLADMGHAGA